LNSLGVSGQNVSGFLNGHGLHPAVDTSGLANIGNAISGLLNSGGYLDSGIGNNGSQISGFFNHFAAEIAALQAFIPQIEAFLNSL
jgi:hypothetical protein